MKVGNLVFALIMTILLIAATALSQEEIIKLESPDLGDHERPVVQFTHEQHANVLECLRCHHDFDKFNNNVGSEGQSCADCHAGIGGKNPIRLKDAFHTQCKSCHEQLLSKGAPSGPLMCGGCHIRR
jgi:Ni,Fe-hydrogenase I small subunit